jgi:DNA methylase
MTASLVARGILNGICPYFTMFPLQFPYQILKRRARQGDRVLDPFCGRGTTNFAARLLGLDSLGVDSSPVATAITNSKLVSVTPESVVAEAQTILANVGALSVPRGDFWKAAYHPAVLAALSRFREAFLQDCTTPERLALRGLILGALHGPKRKTVPSYFSNQCPRTYAPKPAYAVRFWSEHGHIPEPVDVMSLIQRRASRFYGVPLPDVNRAVKLADSRRREGFSSEYQDVRYKWVITSPPYYGMRTYIPDQWLRNWFVGGAEAVDYSNDGQVMHSTPDSFAENLRSVWRNVADICSDDAVMVIRFGGISDRQADARTLVRDSLQDSGWRITRMRKAGFASDGKRQADAFLRQRSKPIAEYDVWTRRE